MIEHSESIAKLATALCAVQSQLSAVQTDSSNPHYKSRYASLEAVLAAVRAPMTSAGLAFVQAPGAIVDNMLDVTTMLMHGPSGEWLRSTLPVPLARRDPQAVGSGITYACRYSLMSMLGIAPSDDDGEGAGRSPPIKNGARPATSIEPPEVLGSAERYMQDCRAFIAKAKTRKALVDDWWSTEKTKGEMADFDLDLSHVNELKSLIINRLNAIKRDDDFVPL